MPGSSQPYITIPRAKYRAAEIRFPEQAAAPTNVAYYLVAVFLAFFYSQLPILFPAVDAVRPVYVVGALAIFILALEKVASKKGFDFVWPEAHLLCGFLFVAAAGCFMALWRGYAFANTVDFIKVVLFVLLLVNSVNQEKQIRYLIWIMVLGGLFPAIGTLKNHFLGHVEEGRAGWVGIFQNPNELAYGLVMLIPLAAYLAAGSKLLKAAFLWAIVMTYIAAIYVSYSRGGMLGLFAVLALVVIRLKSSTGRLLTLLLLSASLAFIVVGWTRTEGFTQLGRDAGVQSRIQTIEAGLAMFSDHPFTGVGAGCSLVAWPIYAPAGIHEKWLVIHNSFIQALAETGMFGFLAYTLLFVLCIRDCRRMTRPATATSGAASHIAAGLELSLWGFVVAAMAGGFAFSWVPYIFVGLVCALKKIVEENALAAKAPSPKQSRL